MGKRGPRPTPKALLEARGSWRGEARTEAEMPKDLPECPPWLTGAARAHWFHLLPMLTAARVIRQTDGPALARLCQTYAQWREAIEWTEKWGAFSSRTVAVRDENGRLELEADGITVRKEVTDTVVWPQVKLALKLAETLTRMEDRFGLNPASRTAVQGDPKAQPDSGKSRFFG